MKRRYLTVVLCLLLLPSLGWTATVLRGTVLEEQSGQPKDAAVLVYKLNDSGGWDFAGSRVTDDAGAYRFTYLDAGTYYLEFRGAGNCDPKVNYCADKYLPQLYNNVALWDFANKTQIVLNDGDDKELDTVSLKTRPFFFATTANPCVPADGNGTVRIPRRVMNTTGFEQWMFFWGVVDSPFRTDASDYYGLQASLSFGKGKWVLLKPGRNFVAFTYKLTPTAIKGRYNYWIIGGDSNLLPMTPYLSGTFCNGVTAEQDAAALSFEASAVGDQNRYGPATIIPTKVSATGTVLEKGLLNLK